MAVTAELALLETRRAFDGVAAEYHRSNAENPTLCEMRRRVLSALMRRVPIGAHVLELGCGPGTDCEVLARSGYSVTAIDWSPAMVEEARRRIATAGLADRVEIRHTGIHELGTLPMTAYDAVYSNFGPLNCVPDIVDVARQISARLRPGGNLVASVIGRVCPWEIALYLARGRWSRATVRFARGLVPVPLNGRTVWTRYYSPSEFERPFRSAGFRHVSVSALGFLAPPPYMEAFRRRHPQLVTQLNQLDERVGGWPLVRACGDHFLIVLERT